MQVSVVMRKVGLATEKTTRALDEMRGSKLNIEQLTALKRVISDATLVELARKKDPPANAEESSTEDLFLKSVASVPRVEQKLEALLVLKEAPSLELDFREQLTALAHAVDLIMTGSAMRTICIVVLQLGNFLNSGANTYAAQGFSLSSLANLVSMKANKGQQSLLDVVLK